MQFTKEKRFFEKKNLKKKIYKIFLLFLDFFFHVKIIYIF